MALDFLPQITYNYLMVMKIFLEICPCPAGMKEECHTMTSFSRSRSGKLLAAILVLGLVVGLGGCKKGAQQQQQGAVQVKSMQVIKRDTPLLYDYTGFIEAQQEMNLVAQVSGQITGKFFKGGDTVQAGQVLYSIDSRTYEAALLNAQANLANARATLANASIDAERYIKLYEQHAVSKQMMDNAVMQRDQARASTGAMEALVRNAQVNMTETKVRAPFNGRIDTTALEVGNYAVAGQTVLGKISDTDPVFVKFSIAEPEYLQLSAAATGSGAALDNLSIILSDGSTYELKGRVAEVNRGMSDNTGTLTIKALFENPNRKLLPGMFAHLQAQSGIKKDALLIPQRAVTEMMYKRFVYVIGSDNKVSMKEITLGPAVGRFFMVNSGLTGDETLVVEGTGKLRQGLEVKAEPMTEAELDTTTTTDQAAKQ